MLTKFQCQAIVSTWCRLMGVPDQLASAIVQVESGWDPNARSAPESADAKLGGAFGLFQVTIATATLIEKGITPGLLLDPAINSRVALVYLRDCLNETSGKWPDAISAYNGGYRPKEGYGAPLSSGLYANDGYVRRVLAALAAAPAT